MERPKGCNVGACRMRMRLGHVLLQVHKIIEECW